MEDKNTAQGIFARTKFLLSNTATVILSVIVVAFGAATLFTAWSPVGFLSSSVSDYIPGDSQPDTTQMPTWPTATARPRQKIGIVAGHWGNDAGAVCSDGLTEAEVNLQIATLVQRNLSQEGYDIDILKEFDTALENYQAMALISIHADSCDYINDQATGFKVASAMSNPRPERAARLTACLRNRYHEITGLNLHSTSVTPDMTSYHAFDEINPETTAVIIETGFLNLDRQLLSENPDLVAEGITAGILCFIRNENITNTQEDEP